MLNLEMFGPKCWKIINAKMNSLSNAYLFYDKVLSLGVEPQHFSCIEYERALLKRCKYLGNDLKGHQSRR